MGDGSCGGEGGDGETAAVSPAGGGERAAPQPKARGTGVSVTQVMIIGRMR